MICTWLAFCVLAYAAERFMPRVFLSPHQPCGNCCRSTTECERCVEAPSDQLQFDADGVVNEDEVCCDDVNATTFVLDRDEAECDGTDIEGCCYWKLDLDPEVCGYACVSASLCAVEFFGEVSSNKLEIRLFPDPGAGPTGSGSLFFEATLPLEEGEASDCELSEVPMVASTNLGGFYIPCKNDGGTSGTVSSL